MRANRAALSKWAAILTFGVLVLALTYAGDAQILLPGPMSNGHSPITNCGDCHSNIKQGPFPWLHALVRPWSARQDSTACLSCHQIATVALQPHGEALDKLQALTDRNRETPAAKLTPIAGVVRNAVLPTGRAFSKGVFCATCHKEHQGDKADLTAVPSKRCQACHVVQFDSFQNGHPDFGRYPFIRRTRINFDHVSHFGEHFPKSRAKTPPSRATQEACADCHTLAADGGHMNVKSFETVCSSCHLHQITGSESLSRHQGMEFIVLPGLDLETLAQRNASIGEWPGRSEAKLTPFMRLLIGWDKDRRSLLDLLGRLDLLNLGEATTREIRAVEWLVWEVKTLMHGLSAAKPSDALQKLSKAAETTPGPALIGGLTAHLPRDVVTAAIREWLPNLETEMADHRPIDATRVAAVNRSADAAFRTRMAEAARDLVRPLDSAPPVPTDSTGIDQSEILSGDEADAAGADQSDILSGDEDLEQADERPPSPEVPKQRRPAAVDAQTWAEFGGWYRQDFAILYKPTGHADAFFKAWLEFSAALPGKRSRDAAHVVFSSLIDEQARGQCAKCHSVDMAAGQSRRINWGPATAATKTGRYTRFSHEPHFGFPGKQGCLTCHQLDEAAEYQKGFANNDPATFASNFKPVRKDVCTTCHTSDAARAECLTCHAYHIHSVTTPIMSTNVPRQ